MADDKKRLRYSDAGVNIDAADEAMREIKKFVSRTFDDNVLCDIGAFGAMYKFDNTMEEPILVSSVDGVGTKLKLAFMTGKHDTVGIDLVSHCVNDILVQGARPIFFLDYLAVGKLEPQIVVDVIKGVANGCRYAGCALIGGETAEMPDMYSPGEYDLAGTIVGVVDRQRIVDGARIQPGDAIIGLASSGLHTNGYSLARKICFSIAGMTVQEEMPGTGKSVGDALLEPHRSYSKIIQLLLKVVDVKGMCHVTGGGITDNLPRALPKDMGAMVDLTAWNAPALFYFLQQTGDVETLEMLRAFNMGIGYIVIVAPDEEERALDTLTQLCETPVVIGRVTKGANKVEYIGELGYDTPN